MAQMVTTSTRQEPGKALFTGGLGDAEAQGCWEPGSQGSKSQLCPEVTAAKGLYLSLCLYFLL